MDAMPQMYRDDIIRTHAAIKEIDALHADVAMVWQPRRAALVRQLEELERALVRAEQDWAAAVAQGAGVRLDSGALEEDAR